MPDDFEERQAAHNRLIRKMALRYAVMLASCELKQTSCVRGRHARQSLHLVFHSPMLVTIKLDAGVFVFLETTNEA